LSGGLAALPPAARYTRESVLYGADRGEASTSGQDDTEEALAIGAAASSNPSDGA
jgi:hypothetical protein